MRICSLLPSATEIVFALGAERSLIGVTHECDYPYQATQIRKVTRSKIPATLSSGEIDSAVSSTLDAVGSIYDLDMDFLETLQPDVVLTQRLCNVCAVSFDDVVQAVESLKSRPTVLNLEPTSLADILANICTVGQAISREPEAEAFVQSLQLRIDVIRNKTKYLLSRPRVLCLEWVDPLYCGGHWMKELVEIAGGTDNFSNHKRPSHRLNWEHVLEVRPEIIVLTCCGFGLDRCAQEGHILARLEGVHELPATKSGRVFATDGSAYFSRPGPRIVESLEILAHLIHPDIFPPPPLSNAFSRLDLSCKKANPM
jgi:iron complex transport system substrate-binding protein